MSGKLIRCMCGTTYDPQAHRDCPACGRPALAPAGPRKEAGAGQPAAPREPVRAARPAAPAVALPGWAWKAAAAGAAVLLLVVLAWQGDDDAADRPASGARSAPAADTGTPPADCPAIAGDWSWFTGGFVHFAADGRAFFKPTQDAPPAITATWSCDPASREYSVAWAHGFTDVLRLYDNDSVLQGTNHTGAAVSGKRWTDPTLGMLPLQTVQAGSQLIPRNLPEAARAAGTVARNWRPDAYLVALEIRRGDWRNKDGFALQFSFYSPAEGTGLWLSSTLTGNRYHEAGTVRWGTIAIEPQFIDFPEAVQVARAAGLRGLIAGAQLRAERRGAQSVRLAWHIRPETHGKGVGAIDATTGKLLP